MARGLWEGTQCKTVKFSQFLHQNWPMISNRDNFPGMPMLWKGNGYVMKNARQRGVVPDKEARIWCFECSGPQRNVADGCLSGETASEKCQCHSLACVQGSQACYLVCYCHLAVSLPQLQLSTTYRTLCEMLTQPFRPCGLGSCSVQLSCPLQEGGCSPASFSVLSYGDLPASTHLKQIQFTISLADAWEVCV